MKHETRKTEDAFNAEAVTLCLRVTSRETYMRTIVYPKRVSEGRVSQELADEEVRVMRNISAFFRCARDMGYSSLGDLLRSGPAV